MKETVTIFNQHGKQISYTRTVYGFTAKKSMLDRTIEFIVWSGLLAICVFFADIFI